MVMKSTKRFTAVSFVATEGPGAVFVYPRRGDHIRSGRVVRPRAPDDADNFGSSVSYDADDGDFLYRAYERPRTGRRRGGSRGSAWTPP